MRAVLIPVKDLSCAKLRLAAMLAQRERTALAAAMMEDVFSAVAAARGIDAVFVVSNDEHVLQRARSLKWELICERRQVSERDSVDHASKICARQGFVAMLRLPIDLPLLRAEDVEDIFAAARPAPAIVLVASRDRTGTNALLRTPPQLFRSHFGPDSFRKHLAEAAAHNATACVLRNARIELDVDNEDDLRVLAAHKEVRGATRAWLQRAEMLPAVSREAFAD